MFKEARFFLDKWHSNCSKPEEIDRSHKSTQQTYTKQQLGFKTGETKMLRIWWDKQQGKLRIDIPFPILKFTKRSILQKLALIYNVLKFMSPITLKANEFHSFGNRAGNRASLIWKCNKRSCICCYETNFLYNAGFHIKQVKTVTENYFNSKIRTCQSNDGLNIAENIQNWLTNLKMIVVHGWSDNMVRLYWFKGNGIYKQFVQKRINHINSKPPINWHYVNIDINSADVCSRGCIASKLQI